MNIRGTRSLTLSVVLLGLALAASCDATVESMTSGSPTGAGGNTNTSTGATGAGSGECLDEQLQCDGQELNFCSNGRLFHFKTCDTTEICEAASASCSCVLGTKRCAGVEKSQECVMGTGGANDWLTTNCPFPRECNPTSGECEIEPPPCIKGDTMCDKDGDTVLQCQLDAGKADWIPVLKCSEEGFENRCQFMPEQANPKMLCMNACNVRGVPIVEEFCAPAGNPFCAVNICDKSGTVMVPDHIDCRGGGQPCSSDEQCLSCFCDSNGLCLSNIYHACGIARLLCE